MLDSARPLTERGATLLEAVIAVPFILLGFIAFTDLARAMLAETLLTAGAEDALTILSRIPNADFDPAPCALPAAPADCAAAWTALTAQIKHAATNVPLKTFMSESGVGFANLEGVHIVRPGNGVTTGPGRHPYLECRHMPAGATYADMFVRCPIGVRVVAKMKTFTPLVPDLSVTGMAFGYREVAYLSTSVPEVRLGE